MTYDPSIAAIVADTVRASAPLPSALADADPETRRYVEIHARYTRTTPAEFYERMKQDRADSLTATDREDALNALADRSRNPY